MAISLSSLLRYLQELIGEWMTLALEFYMVMRHYTCRDNSFSDFLKMKTRLDR